MSSVADRPLVSIVTPFLNPGRFLEESLASVLAQTYTRWEHLLVDDGSSDGSGEIAARWAERHPGRVWLLADAGRGSQGSSAARNLGIRQARGEYLALLDADDVWLPTHLADQTALLERHPEAALAYGPTEEWYSWTGRPEDGVRDQVPSIRIAPGIAMPAPGPLAAFVRRSAPTPCTCSVVARRSVVEAVGGFEEAFPGMYDDQAFYAKLCLAASVVASDTCTSRYRRHAGSLYSKAQSTRSPGPNRLRFLEWLDGYVTRHGVRDRAVRSALGRELWAARHPFIGRLLGRAGI